MKKTIFSILQKDLQLIFLWTRYNIQSDYLNTKLGLLWVVLQPLLMTTIYALIFSLIMDRNLRGGVPFINFFLAGMTLWLSFNGKIMRSTTVVVSKVNIMSQVKFPRYVLVFILFLERMVDFMVSLGILFVLNAIYGYYPTLEYLYLPWIFLIFFSLELGSMFILATLGLFIRDIPQIMNLLLRLLFYFSAIIFPADIIPARVVDILWFNPIFFLVESFRGVIFYADVPNLFGLFLWSVFSLVLFIVGFWFFQRKADLFADYK